MVDLLMLSAERGLGRLLAASPPPRPSNARTARPYLPTTHGVDHGEPAAESAVVGLAGMVDGEQRAATPLGCLALREVPSGITGW